MRDWMRRGKEACVVDDWIRMFRPNWREVALDNTLGRTELRVLLLSAVSLGQNNKILLSQREMAAQLAVTAQSVNRAMRVLVAGGLILQDGHQYHLNSRLAAEQTIPDLFILRKQEARALRELDAHFEEVAS